MRAQGYLCPLFPPHLREETLWLWWNTDCWREAWQAFIFFSFFLKFCDKKDSFSSLIYHLKDLGDQNGSKKGLSSMFITDYLYVICVNCLVSKGISSAWIQRQTWAHVDVVTCVVSAMPGDVFNQCTCHSELWSVQQKGHAAPKRRSPHKVCKKPHPGASVWISHQPLPGLLLWNLSVTSPLSRLVIKSGCRGNPSIRFLLLYGIWDLLV